MKTFTNFLFDTYETYLDKSVSKKDIKHSQIVERIKQLRINKLFTVSTLGTSIENREIFLVKIGNGRKKVLLWSQMHGNEPTATMAMLDIFIFLSKNDLLSEFRAKLLNECTLYFIPMLNPDGAERYQRRNAAQIDINRDAKRLQSPEAQILMQIRDELNPDFGFNLHDQDSHYRCGENPFPACISLLAPSFDVAQSVNDVRKRAIQVIGSISDGLHEYIGGRIARYPDDYNMKCFGDTFQSKATSTILIEAGVYENDADKLLVRKYTYISILSALYAIAEESYQKFELEKYYQIAENQKNFADLIIRNAVIEKSGKQFKIDVSIWQTEMYSSDNQSFYKTNEIDDIGDLEGINSFIEFDACDATIEEGKVYEN